MKKAIIGLLAAGAVALSVPAAAQPSITIPAKQPGEQQELEPEDLAELFADVEMFEIDVPDFTPEQEARLPTAQRVARQLLPEGAFAAVMDGMFEPMLGGMLGEFDGGPRSALSLATGLPETVFADLPDERVMQALNIIDPSRQARIDAILNLTQSLMSEMGALIEPHYRSGIASALAVEFTQEDLSELEVFFSTPLGNRFASRQMSLYGSPYVMNSMNQMGPIMSQIFPGFMERAMAIEEQYGKPKRVSDLQPGDLNELARTLNIDRSVLLDATTIAINPDDYKKVGDE